MSEINGTIYKITNPNGKIYIGQTIRPVEQRWNEYKNLQCENQPKIYRSLMKYGYENHTFEIVETGIKTTEELDAREIYYIAYYDSYKNGLNCTFGGQGGKRISKYQTAGNNYLSAEICKINRIDSVMKNPYQYNSIDEVPKYLKGAYSEGIKQIQKKCQDKYHIYKANMVRKETPVEIRLSDNFTSKQRKVLKVICSYPLTISAISEISGVEKSEVKKILRTADELMDMIKSELINERRCYFNDTRFKFISIPNRIK